MTIDRAPSKARRHAILMAVLALGLASAAAATHAQSKTGQPSASPEQGAAPSQPDAAPAQPSSVEGVTVNVRPRTDLGRISPEKKAALDEEAAKDQAWRDYRKSTPPLTNNPNDDSKDYPGLQTLLPQQ